jgi:hypothetical protein
MSNAGDGDKRKVSTDALETLGTIIGPNEKRDAIHLAVEPIEAGMQLLPGQHVGIRNGKAFVANESALGIVDPFIERPVEAGERFWLVVYPRQIHSLRHVWTHPSFPDEPATVYPPASAKEESEQWIKQYAESIDIGYRRLMSAADYWVDHGGPSKWSNGEYWDGEYLVDGGTLEGVSTSPDFWKHYQIVRGKDVPEKAKTNFFSCSC